MTGPDEGLGAKWRPFELTDLEPYVEKMRAAVVHITETVDEYNRRARWHTPAGRTTRAPRRLR